MGSKMIPWGVGRYPVSTVFSLLWKDLLRCLHLDRWGLRVCLRAELWAPSPQLCSVAISNPAVGALPSLGAVGSGRPFLAGAPGLCPSSATRC